MATPSNIEDSKPSSPSEASSETTQEPSFSLLHEIAFIGAIASSQLLTQAGLGQAVAPLRIIGSHFGSTNPGQLSWYAAGYSLTVGTFILIAGRLGDMYGHKNVYIVGWLWFALWSLLAGVSYYSSSQIFFIICRAFQGIGPALLIPNGLAILGRTYPEGTRKNIAFSIFGGTAPTGFVIGAVFSAIFAEFAWWAWSFWTLAIVCLVLALISIFIIPAQSQGASRNERFDFLGSITGVTGLVLFNIAWNQGPSVGWGSAYVIVFLVLGLLIMALFFYIESRASYPILPLSMLTRPTCFVLACMVAGWSSFGIWMYYSWQFLEELRHISPLLSAAQYSPAPISGMCAALATAYMMPRLPTTAVLTLSLLFFMIADVLLATMPVRQTYWAQMFVALLVAPWGMDLSFPAGTLILSASVPREHQGVAASLIATVVNYSISIGLGIAGTVEVHVNKGGRDVLGGYRGAFYVGIGLSGFGVFISSIALLRQVLKSRVATS